MELLQLKYFSHSAKTENFSHTAKHFLVPTSCISISIKNLENELGVKLFDRFANKIKLNDYGKIFLEAVEQSELLLKKAKADIFDLAQTPFGEIKLLILTNREKVTNTISKFKIKYPKISFTINHQSHDNLSKTNDYDIIITDQKLTSERFSQTFWLSEEIFLAVHKDNAISNKPSISSSELREEKFILMQKNSSLRDFSDKFFSKNGIVPNIVIECDDPQYVRKYLKMGLGVTFFPKISWEEQISDDISLLKIDNGLYRDSFIYTNKSASNIAFLFAQILQTG
ncbi:MAG: LysR family transcriptional regulator [Clostridia bacterium]|nr:LysR family transcriptional regulator [Clostridia bacterium]